MRVIVTALGVVVVLAAVAASSASAESPNAKIRIDERAELVSPQTVRLAFTYYCPVSAVEKQIIATVDQPETDSISFVFTPVPVPCTGDWETVVLSPTAPHPSFAQFEVGPAVATAGLRGGFPQDDTEKRIRIVE